VASRGKSAASFRDWLVIAERFDGGAEAIADLAIEGVRVHGLGYTLDSKRRNRIEAYVSLNGGHARVCRRIAELMSIDTSDLVLVETPGFTSQVEAGAYGRHHADPR
jgi:hypothetical protein